MFSMKSSPTGLMRLTSTGYFSGCSLFMVSCLAGYCRHRGKGRAALQSAAHLDAQSGAKTRDASDHVEPPSGVQGMQIAPKQNTVRRRSGSRAPITVTQEGRVNYLANVATGDRIRWALVAVSCRPWQIALSRVDSDPASPASPVVARRSVRTRPGGAGHAAPLGTRTAVNHAHGEPSSRGSVGSEHRIAHST